ncbi:transposase [Corallincola spongiicola]|uniref:Transposase IS116/IS110/IS902 C-terminal domain-containing protein n=1 Tax=Corallincola spongiicola TaxID=2520508 RepID=A0ABY1WN85_9GAMM|nr:hypothetical protein EXY25_12525 [Corallincola spongiicola]
MNFVELTPSEHSSGQRQKQGGITMCGNTHARRILIEAVGVSFQSQSLL